MNARTLAALGALAVVALVLAVAAGRRGRSDAAEPERLLLPVLSQRINDVRSLVVTTPDGEVTLQRGDEAWSVASKGGYPADGGKARQLLLALRGATIVEEKTANPELYDELGVQDVDSPDAASVRVEARDADGEPVAALIVGERRSARGGSPRTEYYVRRPGEATSWLVEGDLAVDPEARDWLATELFDVARERVRAVRVEHADGEVLYVRRPDATATDFTIVDLPQGKEPTHASAPGAVAAGLQRLTLEDVAPADELPLADPPDAVATFWTFDGLRVTVATDDADGELRARFDVAYDEEGPPGTEAMGPPPPPETDAGAPEDPAEAPEDATAGEDAGAAGGEAAPPTPEGPTPEEVRAEAERLAALVDGWTYVLPSWKKSAFQKRQAELTRDVAPPADEEPSSGSGDGGEATGGDAGSGHAGHDHAGHDHAGHDHAGHDHAGHDHAETPDAETPGAGEGGATDGDPP